MDTTRLDVFALDPITLRWVQAELDGRDGLVYPVCHRDSGDAGVDEVGGCRGGVVSGVSATAGGKGLARARGVARARHPEISAGRRRRGRRTVGRARPGRRSCRKPS